MVAVPKRKPFVKNTPEEDLKVQTLVLNKIEEKMDPSGNRNLLSKKQRPFVSSMAWQAGKKLEHA